MQEATMKSKVLDYKKCRKALMKLRAINHGVRQNILLYIRSKGECTGLEMIMALRDPSVRLHLMILKREGWVETRRSGKNMLYRVNETELARVEEIVHRLNVTKVPLYG